MLNVVEWKWQISLPENYINEIFIVMIMVVIIIIVVDKSSETIVLLETS